MAMFNSYVGLPEGNYLYKYMVAEDTAKNKNDNNNREITLYPQLIISSKTVKVGFDMT